MKRILATLTALCMLFCFACCSRNYTDWKTVTFASTAEGARSENAATFMVPNDWVVSRVDDFWFFASYPIEDLSEILQTPGELYLIGWSNITEPNHAVSELFEHVDLPDDSALFSVGLDNGAIYGQEKYEVDGDMWTKYYVSLKSYDVYELKLIDWQNRCGKQLMKNIAYSYSVDGIRASE